MALDDLKLTFRDEFNSLSLDTGTAATDANFWNTSMYNGWVRTLEGNGELQWYVDADYKGASSTPLGVNPFEVNNGVLSIKARMASTQVRNSLWGYAYTSGVLTSQGEFSQQYGYFEVRAQVPEGQGLWPAFWLLADHNTWPPELDVMEVIGSQTNYVHQTTHTGAGVNQGKATWSNEKLSAGFHTYGMDWTASTITYYLDGKATFTMATPADLHTPMYMLLNLAVGGNWPGDPNDNMDWSKANYNIDYVRVYQHTGVAGSGGVLPISGDGTGSSGTGSGVSTGTGAGTGQLVASNGVDVSGATGARYMAADTGASSSRTYTAAEMGLSGVPSTATMTVAYDAQKSMTITNNGAWNDIKNAAVTSATTSGVTIGNFVAVQVALTNNQNNTVTVTDAKRGNIVTGSGNDTISVSAKSDTNDINMMTIAAGDGANRISFNGAANTRTTITAGSGADVITISGQANAAISSGAGNDTIRSGTGSSTLAGGAGDDTYWVNSAGTTVFENAGEGTDWVLTALEGYTVAANVEVGHIAFNLGRTMYANNAGNTLIGNVGNDTLVGGNGADALYGAAGNDILTGNGGADLMVGGLGDDTYQVDNLADVITENVGEGTDWVLTALDSYTVATNVEVGHIAFNSGRTMYANNGGTTLIGNVGSDTLIGGNGADALYGAAGNDTLTGNGGADLMVGGLGNDTYSVDSLSDVITENLGEGTDWVLTALEGYTVAANVEVGHIAFNLGRTMYANNAGNTLIGNVGNDTLVGGNGADALYGAAGNDILTGNGGADLMVGGLGDDTYQVDNLADVITENVGEGTDWVLTALDSYTVATNVEVGHIAFNSGRTMYANNGGTTLIGNVGSDTLIGGNGADALYGAAGNDTLTGNGGDDYISGGGGNNILVGGAGRDIFAFVAGAHATITDFNVAEDRIELTGVSASSLTMRTSGNSTLIDLNGNTVMTLSGVTAPSNAISFI